MRNRSTHGRTFRVILLAGIACCIGPGTAFGTTYDRSPRTAVLLSDSQRFIAQDGWNSVAVYQTSGATAVVHRFPAPAGINEIAVTSDEKRLLIACSDGSLAVWEIETGKRVWEQTPKQTGLSYIYDTSFAHDGESCIACDHRGQAVVLKTATGERLGVVRVPPMQTNVMSAALAPDGRSGVLIDLGERLYTFDVATGTPKDTGMTGAWPVRFSANGKFIAFRSNNSGVREQVRVVAMDGKFVKRDTGAFAHIGHIRPEGDEAFLISGRVGEWSDETAVIVGARVRSGNEEAEELWRRPVWTGVEIKTDFSPQSMIGVSTEARLVTTVVDLRTGAALQEIDNSANYRPRMVSFSSGGGVGWFRRSWLACLVFTGALVVGVTAIVARLRAKRRKTATRVTSQGDDGRPVEGRAQDAEERQ